MTEQAEDPWENFTSPAREILRGDVLAGPLKCLGPVVDTYSVDLRQVVSFAPKGKKITVRGLTHDVMIESRRPYEWVTVEDPTIGDVVDRLNDREPVFLGTVASPKVFGKAIASEEPYPIANQAVRLVMGARFRVLSIAQYTKVSVEAVGRKDDVLTGMAIVVKEYR